MAKHQNWDSRIFSNEFNVECDPGFFFSQLFIFLNKTMYNFPWNNVLSSFFDIVWNYSKLYQCFWLECNKILKGLKALNSFFTVTSKYTFQTKPKSRLNLSSPYSNTVTCSCVQPELSSLKFARVFLTIGEKKQKQEQVTESWNAPLCTRQSCSLKISILFSSRLGLDSGWHYAKLNILKRTVLVHVWVYCSAYLYCK